MTKSLLFLTLIYSTLSFSQGIELMSNNYPTNPSSNPFPDGTVHLYSCLTGSAAGVNGVPITLSWHNYVGWGTHTHEADNFVARPDPVVTGSLIQLTGFDGNAPGCVAWDVIFNGFAGGYTFEAKSPGFPVKGINYITRYHEFSVLRTPTYFTPYTGGCWSDDPVCTGSNLAVNKSYDLHPDVRHLRIHGQWHSYTDVSRYVATSAKSNFVNMSLAYKQDTQQQLGGMFDLLDITRISLPDGGIYDNDINGIAPGPDQSIGDWNTRAFEEHARGVEADIYVPSGTTRQNIAFASITANNCYVGIFAPNGTPLGDRVAAEAYWRQKFIMHVTCRAGVALRRRPN